MKKIISYVVAISIGLMAVAPPINYDIPLVINSFFWLYMIIAAGFLGFLLMFQDVHLALKFLMVYLFIICFHSQAPASSFNAYVLLCATMYFFLACKECDYNIILKVVQAVFWFQITIMIFQHFNLDKLMCFGTGFNLNDKGDMIRSTTETPKIVYWGTVFQQMRLASLFAIMSPFLLLRSKWYIIPIEITCLMLGSLNYTFAIGAGFLVFAWFEFKEKRKLIALGIFLFCALAAIPSWSHIRVEFIEGRIPVWWVVIKTWVMDTTGPMMTRHGHRTQWGPFQLDKFLFGHGMDTFLPLFPYYKHDPNPFPQAHNDWLQLAWETGLIGFCIFTFWYCAHLIKRVLKRKEYLLLGGLAAIAVNMFFAFPWRMTQTVLFMVAWVALCEQPHLAKR